MSELGAARTQFGPKAGTTDLESKPGQVVMMTGTHSSQIIQAPRKRPSYSFTFPAKNVRSVQDKIDNGHNEEFMK